MKTLKETIADALGRTSYLCVSLPSFDIALTMGAMLMDEFDWDDESYIRNDQYTGNRFEFQIEVATGKVFSPSGEAMYLDAPIKLYARCKDRSTYTFLDVDRKPVASLIRSYVPDFLYPLSEEYGDAVSLLITPFEEGSIIIPWDKSGTMLREWLSDYDPDCLESALRVFEPQPMSFSEYQKKALRTAGNIDYAILGLGIAGESGEVADYLKKVLGHGHPLDKDIMAKELGDILWYIAVLCERVGVPLEEIANRNIEKLKVRYPEGFSSERSINREES